MISREVQKVSKEALIVLEEHLCLDGLDIFRTKIFSSRVSPNSRTRQPLNNQIEDNFLRKRTNEFKININKNFDLDLVRQKAKYSVKTYSSENGWTRRN